MPSCQPLSQGFHISNFLLKNLYIKIYHIKKQPLEWLHLVRNSPDKFWQFYTFPFMPHDDQKKCFDLFDRVEGELCTLALYSLVLLFQR